MVKRETRSAEDDVRSRSVEEIRIYLEDDPDDSFDHVLDGLPHSNTSPLSTLCGCCRRSIDESSGIVQKK